MAIAIIFQATEAKTVGSGPLFNWEDLVGHSKRRFQVEALRPSQQFLSHVGMFWVAMKMKCLALGHNTVPSVRFDPMTLQSSV